MIIRKDEYLGLSGETTKCGGMENAVTIALETRAEGVGFLRDGSPTGADGASRERREE